MIRQPSVQVCAVECGAQCCRAPRFVMLTTGEMRRLKSLDSDVRVINDRSGVWVMEHLDVCVFLDDNNLCSIYDQRPEGCRRFPTKPSPDCLVWPIGGGV